MICPHCKKPFKKEHSKELRDKAIKLYNEGYSLRDVEFKLDRVASFAQISRWVRKDRGLK